jgi:hypothetical protein
MPHHDVETPRQVSILESIKKTLKQKFLTPTSNLTWLRATVRKFNSGADMSEIWLRAQYNNYRRLFLIPTIICRPWYDKWSKSYEFLNISQVAVSLCWQTGTTWDNCIFDHWGVIISGNLQYKLVVNFLHFPVVIRMLKSDKQGTSYDRWNTTHKWKNHGYIFWFGLMMISQNSADWIWCRSRRMSNVKVIDNFETFP